MDKLPLETKLRKRIHRDTAILQDIVMDEIYSSVDLAFHGGTCIWRVYKGNRFSEDLDFYMKRWHPENVKKALKRLESFGIKLTKFKTTVNTIFSSLKKDNVSVKVEISKPHWSFRSELKEYERINGSYLPIYVLPPEDLFKEKVETYLHRRLIRDIYDVYHLYSICNHEKIKKYGRILINNLPEPVDESVLKTLIITGRAPSFNEIKSKLERWFL
ncbi:nucleotidyl transferase AbiEii/AbiGii toxin family protein [Candidatus Micrarchaeota archaeon]|nr:nucleotidyl transferase AbiEii/AbiGii toxin family protein [Candidatus Micrarchaeota archaeon]